MSFAYFTSMPLINIIAAVAVGRLAFLDLPWLKQHFWTMTGAVRLMVTKPKYWQAWIAALGYFVFLAAVLAQFYFVFLALIPYGKSLFSACSIADCQ